MFRIQDITIPTTPGCYIYKDARGEVLYVGKAKQLRNRVRSYFHNKNHDTKTQALVQKIRDVEFMITRTEVEALLLEQSLIHRHQPPYNIDLKGTIRYAYIKLTDEPFPRLVTSRKMEKKGTYYGPYTDGTARREVIGAVTRLFKIRTCVHMPKKVCLQYHLGNCMGPCALHQTREEYMTNIHNAERVLAGHTTEVIKDLELLMREASKVKKFEMAKVYRDQIRALESVSERQSIDQAKAHNQDVINWLVEGKQVHVQVFNVRNGVLTSRHTFTLQDYVGVVEDFVAHFYSIHAIPEEIILPRLLEGQEVMQEYLARMKQQKFSLHIQPRVTLTVPQRGVKRDLLNLVAQNLSVSAGIEPGVTDLQEVLRLASPPAVIDFFDISNLKNKYIVGACIRLENGVYKKNEYRKFKVRSTKTQDDFASMLEVVSRRYARLRKDGGTLPDLVCIDGGKGQLHAAMEALEKLSLSLPLCSLAKREEEIYQPGAVSPIRLSLRRPGVRLLMKGRDEVHRFVISYNRYLRKEILR